MASDPVGGNAQIRAPNKKQDDFDMAKLQKRLKHEQRQSSNSKNKAAKLSPAEIRSLNYADDIVKSGTSRSNQRKAAKSISSSTPPMTPDRNSGSRDKHQRQKFTPAPDTPPISPDRQRRGSDASSRVIHAPQPLSHTQVPAFSTAAPAISRPSSQTSYRGIATYRGPEMTRSGSLTMLQRPSPEIVSNPLSNFSRPRKTTITSPDKATASQRTSEDNIISPVPRKPQSHTLDVVSRTTSRQHSPVRVSDSPVSGDEGRSPEKNRSNGATVGSEVPVVRLTPGAPPEVPVDDPSETSAKQKLNWRRTTTGLSTADSEMAPLRREGKRRTFVLPRAGQCLHAVHYADTKPGEPPQLRDTLRDELPSTQTSVFKSGDKIRVSNSYGFSQHPAVRPLSQDGEQSFDTMPDSSTSSSRKGKGREVESDSITNTDATSLSSGSTYIRCDCCGRMVKPGGYASDLTPVLENENGRINIDSEVDNMQLGRRQRSSSYGTSASPYAPVSAMGVDAPKQVDMPGPRRQSMPPVAPSFVGSPSAGLVGVAINKPGDLIGPSSMPLAIMPQSKTAPKFTRFGSLHARNEDLPGENKENSRTDAAQNLAPPVIQRFGSLYGVRNAYLADEVVQPQPQPQSESQIAPQFQSVPQQQSLPPNQLQTQNLSAYQVQQLRRNPPGPANGYNGYPSANPSRQSLVNSRSKLSQEIYSSREEPLPDIPMLPRNQTMPSSEVQDMVTKTQNQTPISPSAPTQIPSTNVPFAMPSADNDDEPMVDISSFDGHFVHGSVARSPTVLKSAIPFTTSHGQQQEEITHTSPSRPTRIDTSVAAAATSPTSTSAYTSASIPSSVQSYSKADFETYHSATTYPTATTNADRPNVNSSESETVGEVVSKRHPTTIVRIIPSPVIVSASASPISASSNGQLRLGDWILPESPKAGNNSTNSSRNNITQSANSVSGRIGVIA